MLRRAGHLARLWSEFNYQRSAARELLWQAQDGYCGCGCCRRLVSHFRHPRSGDRDTFDHVVPRGLHGEDRLGNILLYTVNCNGKKGSRWPTALEADILRAINVKLDWRTPAILNERTPEYETRHL